MQALVYLLFLHLAPAQTTSKPEVVIIKVEATENGFEPNVISAEPGKAVKLVVTRAPAAACNTSIQIPEKKIKRKMPRRKSISINLGVLEKGSLHFGCGKEMTAPGIIYVK